MCLFEQILPGMNGLMANTENLPAYYLCTRLAQHFPYEPVAVLEHLTRAVWYFGLSTAGLF